MSSITNSLDKRIALAKEAIAGADAILIGAGAGLSTAAGLDYSGPAFRSEFAEFIDRYGITDLYTSSFYPFETEEEKWAYWSKHVMFARFDPPALPLYLEILKLVAGRDYFVITTNVDGQFRKAGFDPDRLFEVQGDYAYIQGVKALDGKRYYAEDMFREMVARQKDCRIPSELVPHCPGTGEPMDINVRKGQYFVQDETWDAQAGAYNEFLRVAQNDNHVMLSEAKHPKLVLLEFGVGFNTPTIIRYPFERMAAQMAGITLIRFNKDYPSRQLEGPGGFIPFTELTPQTIQAIL